MTVGLQTKEKQLVDTSYQADKAWLLDIQSKLYTWSRANPDDAWRDMWNWVTDPRNLRLAWRRIPTTRWSPESPVHNERCTPGLGTREVETAGGDSGTAPSPYVHMRKPAQAAASEEAEPVDEPG